jgi:hypothetical protein
MVRCLFNHLLSLKYIAMIFFGVIWCFIPFAMIGLLVMFARRFRDGD